MDYTIILTACNETGSAVIHIDNCDDIISGCIVAVKELEDIHKGSEWLVCAVLHGHHHDISDTIPRKLQA